MLFVDTSFWAALVNERDDRHEEAARMLRMWSTQELVTTNHVRGETWTLLIQRQGHHWAVAYLDRLERSARLRLTGVSDELEREALRWLRQHDERPYSFVDATSFAVMRDLHIRQALAFDEDFVAAGFALIES